MDEKSTSLEEERNFLETLIGTSTVTGVIDLTAYGRRGGFPNAAIHLSNFGDLHYEDSDTLTHFQDQVIRELATKLAEARRDLESLRKVELLPIPDRLKLNPIHREQLRVEIRKVERARFQFREDE